MDWIYDESFRFDCPLFADEFVGGEPLEGLETTTEVVRRDEALEMGSELFMVVIVEALDGCVLYRPVHSLNLRLSPWVLHLGQTMLNAVLVADAVEDVIAGIFIPLLIGELDAIICENGLDAVRDCLDQIAQELGCVGNPPAN